MYQPISPGRKRVRLFPPEFVREMYPNPLGADGRTVQSRVDLTLDKAALRERFPLFAASRAMDGAGLEVVLLPGQALFIPAFWWHQVLFNSVRLLFIMIHYHFYDTPSSPVR